MRRPVPQVLPDEALIPAANLVRPPPNRFTHELTVDQPYRLDPANEQPDGLLPAGSLVVLLVDEGARSRVVTPAGLYVVIPTTSIRPLQG